MLRQVVDDAPDDVHLFTFPRDCLLLEMDNMKNVWRDAGCHGRFNTAMMQNSIVTAAGDPINKLSEEDLKALARWTTQCMLLRKYITMRRKRQIDHSSIIRRVLKLNDCWLDHKFGVENDTELQTMTWDQGEVGKKEKKKMIANQ